LLALLRANDNKDSYLRFAASYALSKLDAKPALAKAAKDPSAAVRLGVLLAYRQQQDPAIAAFLNDSDAAIVREAATAINDAPIEGAYAALAGKLASAPARDQALVVRAINANYRLGGAPRALELTSYASSDKAGPEMRAEALMQLSLWGKTPQRDRVVGIFRPLKSRPADDAVAALGPAVSKLLGGGSPESVKLAAIDAVDTLQLRAAAPELIAAVSNDQAPESVRSAALKALDGFGGDAVLKAIPGAEKSTVPALRLTALQIVAHRAPDKALPMIKRFAETGSEDEQRAAFQALGQLQSPQAPALLVAALDQLAAGKVQPGAQVELLDVVDKSEAPEVKARWEKQKAAWTAAGNPLAPYQFALAGGSALRGSQQFFDNQVLPCARCHKVGAEGGEAGPNLTRVGAQHPAEYLLESVVKPSAHIAPGFDLVTLTLANGDTESGSVVSESATQIVLKRGDGTQATVDTRQVKQRTLAPSSMPEIYGQYLTRSQLRDVVAFLKSLDGKHGRDGNPPEESFGVSNRAMQSVAVEGPTGGHP
jgi:quinoprotein glucose dehydrogenase